MINLYEMGFNERKQAAAISGNASLTSRIARASSFPAEACTERDSLLAIVSTDRESSEGTKKKRVGGK